MKLIGGNFVLMAVVWHHRRMAAIVTVRAYKGEDILIPLTMVPPRSIAGWTFAFTMKVKESDVTPILTLSNSAFTITDPVNGLFYCIILAAQWTTPTNIPVGAYHWDVWRVDSGSATALTVGIINVLESARGGV